MEETKKEDKKKEENSRPHFTKVIEYNEDVERFVRNVIAPLNVERVILQESVLILQDSNKKTKSLLIGRESKNLTLINRAVRRFFNVEVKVM